jgi:hypothetical protein
MSGPNQSPLKKDPKAYENLPDLVLLHPPPNPDQSDSKGGIYDGEDVEVE